jgi:S-layer homology domain/Bacterial pre-peptidase C-terminal domain
MKKKSTSHSAFLNLRVLFGLFVMLAGVFLALVSFGPARTGFAQGTTRAEMTLALAQALGAINPPACVAGSEMFTDVPASNPFCPFIEELARRGITGGCGGGKFCPGDPVRRQEMAVFIIKAVEGITMESEPNDSIATANAYPPSGPAQGGIMGVPGDIIGRADFWRVQFPGGTFRAETRSYNNCSTIAPGLGDTVITLFDANGNQVANDDDGGFGNCSLIEMPLAAGTYYVRVRSFGSTDVAWYGLFIRVSGQPLIPVGVDLRPAGAAPSWETK